jgi:exodeoxyribonuclease VII large subunit
LMELSRKVHELGTRRGFRKPLDLLRQRRQQVDDLNSRLAVGLRGRLDVSRRRLGLAHLRIARFDLRAKIGALHRQLQNLDSRCAVGLRGRLDASRRRLAAAHLGLVRFDFRAKISKLRFGLQRCSIDLGVRIERILRVKRERLERLSVLLEERSPMKVLERGYAIATDAAGNVIREVAQVSIGDTATIHLQGGRLITEVKDKQE